MAKFLMLGRYSSEAIKGASGERTKRAVSLIQQGGGKVSAIYALLGNYDLALMVEFPGVAEALKGAFALAKMTGISFTTLPAIAVEEFDQMLA